jgi:hypothetical protein
MNQFPRTAQTLALAVLALLSFAAAPPPAGANNPKLSTAYTYTVGDDIADRMRSIFRITAGLESGTLVYYDRKDRNIVTEIIGSAADSPGAQREIEAFVAAIRDKVVGYAKRVHDLPLSDLDVTLIYYNDSGEEPPYEVVRRENGKFVVPVVKDEGE